MKRLNELRFLSIEATRVSSSCAVVTKRIFAICLNYRYYKSIPVCIHLNFHTPYIPVFCSFRQITLFGRKSQVEIQQKRVQKYRISESRSFLYLTRITGSTKCLPPRGTYCSHITLSLCVHRHHHQHSDQQPLTSLFACVTADTSAWSRCYSALAPAAQASPVELPRHRTTTMS